MENRKVKIVEPNKGKHVAVVGDINTIVASKEDTGGTYSFIDVKVFPGGGPPPHIQTREYEGFYIIEGEITFMVDKQRIELCFLTILIQRSYDYCSVRYMLFISNISTKNGMQNHHFLLLYVYFCFSSTTCLNIQGFIVLSLILQAVKCQAISSAKYAAANPITGYNARDSNMF